jgi:hypothetical protein
VRFTFAFAAREGLPEGSEYIPDELWDESCESFPWPEGA